MRKVILVSLSALGVAVVVACASKVPSFIDPEPDGGKPIDGGFLLPDGAFVPNDGGPDGGGDGAAPNDPGYTSGTRLRARVWSGSDGSEQFIDWYDNSRKEECSFRTGADGVDRCLPSGAYAGSLFSDASCTQRIAYATKGCAAPKYADTYDTATCGLFKYHMFPVTGAYSPGSLYALSGNSCQATAPNAWTASYDLYSVGAEIPASSFQDATIVTK
jgi:hypothetical protein